MKRMRKRQLKRRNSIITLTVLIAFALTFSVAYGLYETTYPWMNYRCDTARSGYQPVSTPNTNSTLWSWSAPSGYPKDPVIAEGIVYVAAYDDLYAIDETTGAQLWTVDVNGAGSSSNIGVRNPTVSDGKLYVGDVEGYLWCLNATNGQEIWHWPTAIPPGDINTSPVVANGRVYFGTDDGASGNNYLVAVNATTGEREWWYTAPDNSIFSSPAVDGTWIFFGCDDGKVYALNDTGNFATLKWSRTTQGRVRSTPCVYEDKLFFGSSNTDHSVFAVNKTTGESIWNFTLTSYLEIAYSLAVANDIVYFASPSRYVYALNASITPGSYSETSPGEIVLWRSLQFTESTLRSPAVTNDKVFLTAGNFLYTLDINNGLKLWSYDLNYAYDEGPVVADGRIFVTDSTELHCFGDFYPPNTYHYPVVGTGYEFVVEIVANATCKDFDYSNLESEMRLTYSLDANWNTNHVLMSNITIPHDMLGGPYILTVDGGGPASIEFNSNATHTVIHFTYLHESHDSHVIEISGTTVIPEFSLYTILLLLVLAPLATAVLLRRKVLNN